MKIFLLLTVTMLYSCASNEPPLRTEHINTYSQDDESEVFGWDFEIDGERFTGSWTANGSQADNTQIQRLRGSDISRADYERIIIPINVGGLEEADNNNEEQKNNVVGLQGQHAVTSGEGSERSIIQRAEERIREFTRDSGEILCEKADFFCEEKIR